MEKDKTEGRLMSLDALRGFDMLFIMGGQAVIYAVAALFGYPNFIKVFGHVPWDGLQFVDTIFPLFLFLAGVSFPFSCAKSRVNGKTSGEIARKAFKRFLILAFLGVLGPLCTCKFGTVRVWSVLGRIGLAWMCAAFLYLTVSTRTRLVLAGVTLVGVTVFSLFVLAPDAATIAYPDTMKSLMGCGRGPFSPAGNFGCWLDRTLTAGHTFRPLFDPEGFAGILPAIVTAMLGMFAGDLLRRADWSGTRKTCVLLGCGAGCAAVGLAATPICPLVKALWTPTFVLVVGGYSFVMLAVFYWVIDVRKWVRWSFFFRVIGLNAITIYMAQRILGFKQANNFFFGGLASLVPANWGALIQAVGYVVVCWLFLFFLYRRKIFLKV